jgi:scopoletin glucosyltransferase
MPMVDIAKIFIKHKVECSLILTPLHASRFSSAIYNYNLKLLTFQFPYISSLPVGCESTDVLPSPDLLENFVTAVDLLEQPFRELVRNNPPDAVVSDAFLPWVAIASAKLRILHYSFSSTGCFNLSVKRSLLSYTPQQNTTSDSDPISVLRNRIYLRKSEVAKAAHSGKKQKEFFDRSSFFILHFLENNEIVL